MRFRNIFKICLAFGNLSLGMPINVMLIKKNMYWRVISCHKGDLFPKVASTLLICAEYCTVLNSNRTYLCLLMIKIFTNCGE